MTRASMLVGFAWLALSGSAWAQAEDPAPDPAAAPPGQGMAAHVSATEAGAVTAAPDRKMQVGLSLLPMPVGRGNGYLDLAFSYGVGLSLGYVLIRGLTVGVAPQVLFNIKHDDNAAASKEYDLMARVAYAFRVAAKIAVYGEALLGYSVIAHPTGDSARGLVQAYGGGGMVDITDRVFVNLGVGYQFGLQKLRVDGTSYDHNTMFLRIALGTGLKF